jgi:hypothetical protein
MKRLITVLFAVLLVAGYSTSQATQDTQGTQDTQTIQVTQDTENTQDKTEISFINMHCREHAAEYMDFTADIYKECMDLHTKGLVKTDSTDEHLSVAHY